jgi:putative oxidoreductase
MATRDGNSSHAVLSHADGVATSTADILLLVGRILLAWVFLRSGYGKIFDIGAVAASYPARGLPPVLAYIATPFEFFGAIALIFGFATRYVVIGYVIFLLVATFSTHRYWEFADAAARRGQIFNFDKNLSMLGGLLALFICGPGRLSVDNWLRGRK